MITYLRPGKGISPIHWDKIIGRKLINDQKKGELIHLDNIDPSF